MLQPKSITRPNPYTLKFEWRDGYSAVIKLESFRKDCPCALCKGESIGGKTLIAPKMFNMLTPGQNILKSLNSVGNYAINAVWGDGHDTGIYDWTSVRDLCEKYALSQEQIEKIEKLPKQTGFN